MKYLFVVLCSIFLTWTVMTILFFKNNDLIITEKIEFATKDAAFSFTCIPSKGRDYAMMLRSFEEFKAQNNLPKELEVYRITNKNYLKIDSWCRYKILPECNHKKLSVWKW